MDPTLSSADDAIAITLREIQRDRQKLVPFLRLPPDLIIRVLYLLTRSEKQPLKRLHFLSQICRQVQHIVNDTPSLWVIMSLSDPRFLLERAILLSRQASLVIQADERQLDFLSPEFTARLKILRGQQYRWYSASFTFCSMLVPSELCPAVAPLLQRLVVCCPGSDNGSFPVFAALPTEAPMLKSVTLEGVPVPWTAPALTNLHSLHIRNPFDDPTITEVTELLERNGTLRELEIHLPLQTLKSPPPTHNRRPTQFPHLRRLKLLDLTPAFVWSLLSGIHAPLCASFHLTMCSASFATDSELRGAFQQAFDFLPTAPSGRKAQFRITIRNRNRKVQLLQGPERRPVFELQWWEGDDYVGQDWLIKSHLLHHTEVSVWFEPQEFANDEALKTFLLDFGSSVSTLDFHSRANNKWLLGILGTPLDDGTFPFPILANLAFGAQCDLRALLDVVKVRYGRTQGEGMATLPVPSTTLDVGPKGRAYTPEEYGKIRAEIEAVVGSGVLVSRS